MADSRGIRVLIAEDDFLISELVVRTLRRAGYEQIAEVSNGAEAVTMVRSLRPDVVLMDIQMPGLDGLEATRRIQESCPTPVIILTAHESEELVEEASRAGAAAYLTKPPTGGEIDRAITIAIARHGDLMAHRVLSAELEARKRELEEALCDKERLSSQLRSRLSEAELVNAVHAIGLEANSVDDTARGLLEVFAGIVAAPLLGIGIADETGTDVYLRAADQHLRLDHSAMAVRRVVEEVGGEGPARVTCFPGAAAVDDDRDLAAEPLVSVALRMRGAASRLVALSHGAGRGGEVPSELLARAAGQAGLVLENARLTARLRFLSTKDGLTGLFNYRAIREELAGEVQRWQRYGTPLSVIMCDLDRFKAVNDSHGHLAGDAVLEQTARIIEATLRACDLAGRYGGDEFLIVLPSSGIEGARTAARRIRSALTRAPLAVAEGWEVEVTASFGAACTMELSEVLEADDLISQADARVRRVKAAGGDGVLP